MTELFRRATGRFTGLKTLTPEAPIALAVVGVAIVLGLPTLFHVISWGTSVIGATLSWGIAFVASVLPGSHGVQRMSFPSGSLAADSLNPLSTRSDDPVLSFAFLVCSYCLGVSTIVLLVALPVYLFSSSPARSRRAGAVVTTTLGFIITTGSGVVTYLGYTKAR
jgi:hypothetical protein